MPGAGRLYGSYCTLLSSPWVFIGLFKPVKLRQDRATVDAAQRSCGCLLPGSLQGQAGWSSEQPGVVEDVPAYGRGVGTR